MGWDIGAWLSDNWKGLASDALTGGLSTAFNAYQKITSAENENLSLMEKLSMGADRLLDPGGLIDAGTRVGGSYLPQEIRNVAPAVGGTIGGIVGGVYGGPVGAAGGAAAGTGIGAKIKGETYLDSFIKSGIAAATAYASAAAGAPSGLDAEPGLTGSAYVNQVNMNNALEMAGEQGMTGDAYQQQYMQNNPDYSQAMSQSGKILQSALTGEPNAHTPTSTPGPTLGVNTVDIPEYIMNSFRGVSGEKGLSKPSKPVYYEAFNRKKDFNFSPMLINAFKEFKEERRNGLD